MSEFRSYSQAGQDRFVYERIGEKGTFLDIGCNDPQFRSNTYALEIDYDWTGIRVDCENISDSPARSSIFIQADATKLDWNELLHNVERIDYLSLDCDGATLDVLRALPIDRVRFRVITIEHDAWRFGDGPRIAMREILSRQGYKLERADVECDGYPFEDWWVDV